MRTVYNNYCRYTVGQGRLIYDPQDPKMSCTQFVKLCWDMGVVQSNGGTWGWCSPMVGHGGGAVQW